MVSTSDKKELRTAITEAFEEFISSFSSFGEEQVNQLFPSSEWTPVQVASHIIMASDGVPDGKTEKTDRPYDSMLPKIRPWWEDFNQKFQSPESIKPDNKPRSKSEVIAELKRVHQKDLAIVDEQDLAMICSDRQLPSIGYLTRYEWLWFIQMHLKRHIFQLSKMK